LVYEFVVCENSTIIAQREKNVTSLSQILSIPRFEANNTRRTSTTLHYYNKLLTSVTFVAKVQKKLVRNATKELAIQERKKKKQKSSKKKQDCKRKRTNKLILW